MEEKQIWQILGSKPLNEISMDEGISALSFYYKVKENELKEEIKSLKELQLLIARVRAEIITIIEEAEKKK